MKTKLFKNPLIVLILLGLTLTNLPLNFGLNQIQAEETTKEISNTGQLFEESESLPFRHLMPGRTEGTGTYFEIKDSQYLNITLKSTEEIKVVLESIPRMISLIVMDTNTNTESISVASIPITTATPATTLTIEGLESNRTYYRYQNSYRNLVVFVSDENGSYSWEQDISKSHHIWFQEIKSTVFLPEDCSKYGTWNETTKTCTLTQDLFESVEIATNNITLDCNNYKITGNNTGYGIYLNNKENVTIKNCNATNFSNGIYLYSSSNNNLINNVVSLNNWSAIGLIHSSNDNTISNNTVSNNGQFGIEIEPNSNGNDVANNIVNRNSTYGIFLGASSGNSLISNQVFDNYYIGIALGFSSGNILTKNIISNNIRNFDVYGTAFSHFLNSIDTANKINGKSIQYLVGENDLVIDSSWDIGYLGIVNSTNITVKDLTMKDNAQGVLLAYSTNSKIENLTAINNTYGIVLEGSSNNTVINNKALMNGGIGIDLRARSKNNNIINNNVSNNSYGISLGTSSSNTVSNNTINSNSRYGIYLGYSANYNFVERNNINFNGECGLRIWQDSYDNIIKNNNIRENKKYNICLGYLDSVYYGYNKIYHNNFINSVSQVSIQNATKVVFDNGYPSGGNYWSDYAGRDEKSGLNQDQPGSDGIGDNPYVFTGGQDNYPFMKENGWEFSFEPLPPPEKALPPEGILLPVKVSNTPLGILNLRKTPGTENKPPDDILKIVPNDWVLKLISKTDENGQTVDKDGYIWWKVENPGNGVTGWMAAQKSDGNEKYLVPGKLEKIKEITDTDPEKAKRLRVDEILKSMDLYYSNTDIHSPDYGSTSLYKSNDWGLKCDDYNLNCVADPNNISFLRNYSFPIELILAITAHESGDYYFDNEVYGEDIVGDYANGGVGIMQITDKDLNVTQYPFFNRGFGSNLKCYINQCKKAGEDFYQYPGGPRHKNKYYTNTRQGVYANIKDGLKVLQRAYQDSFGKNSTDINRWIGAVWRYNHGSAPVGGIPSGDGYLAVVADKIDPNHNKKIENYFIDYKIKLNNLHPYQFLTNTERIELADKMKTYIAGEIFSPVELRIYDSQGRITGSVNGEVKNEIPDSDYDDERFLILTPTDSFNYEIVGKEEGEYGLRITSVRGGKGVSFTASNIPVSAEEIHQYIIDWQSLSQGKNGVIVKIDINGDGAPERVITVDNNLTLEEFISKNRSK